MANNNLFANSDNNPTDPDPTKVTPKKDLFARSNEETTDVSSPILGSLTTNINLDDYSSYMKDVRPEFGVDTLNLQRARNQSAGEKWMGFANQLVVGEVLGGTIGALGTIAELPIAILTELAGGDADFNNMFMEFGKGIQDWTKEATAIHQEKPNESWNYNDLGWWLSNGVSIGSTLSMIVPAMAGTRAISLFGKAANAMGKAGKLEKADKLLRATETMSQANKLAVKATVSGLIMRNAENMKESFDVSNDIKAKTLKKASTPKGWAELQQTALAKELALEGRPVTKENMANFAAAKAGWRTYVANAPNVVFDILQAGAFLKVNYLTRGAKVSGLKGRKDIAKAQAKALGKVHTKGDDALITAAYLGAGMSGMASEGVEEAINYIGGKYGKQYGEGLLNDTNGLVNYGDVARKSMGEGHLWEAAFFGSLGGGVFQGAGSVYSSLSNKGGQVEAKMVLAEIEGRGEILKEFQDKVTDIATGLADEEFDLKDAKRLMSVARDNLGLGLGISAAKAGDVDLLLEQINQPEFRSQLAAEMTAEDNNSPAMENVDDLLKQLNDNIVKVERHYDAAANKFLYRSSLNPLTRDKLVNEYVFESYVKDKSETYIQGNETEITGILNSVPEYKAAIEKGIPVRTMFELAALEVYKENINYAKHKDKLDTLIKDAKAVVDAAAETTFTGSKTPNPKVYRLIRENIENNLRKDLAEDRLADLDTDKGIDRRNEMVETKLKDDKKKHEENLLKEYKANVVDKTKEMSPTDAKAYITSLKASEKDAEKLKYLDNRIRHFQGLQDTEAKQAAIIKGAVSGTGEVTPASSEANQGSKSALPTDEDERKHNLALGNELEDNKGTEEERIKSGSDFLDQLEAIEDNSEMTNAEKQQALKDLHEMIKGQKAPVALQEVEFAITRVKNAFRSEVFDESKGVKTGDQYKNDVYNFTIDGFVTDSNGKVYINFSYKALDETGEILSYQGEFADLKNLTKVTPVVESKTSIKALEDVVQEVSDSGLTQEFVYESKLDGFQYTAKIVVGIPMNLDYFDVANGPAYYVPSENKIYVDATALENENLQDLIEHELAHAEINFVVDQESNSTETRENLDKALTEVIANLTLPSKYNGTKTADYFAVIKNNKTQPEELVAYAMIDAGIRDILNTQADMTFFPALYKAGLKHLIEHIKNKDVPTQPVTTKSTVEVLNYKATPAAQEFADMYGINMTAVTGTGKDGRILIGDVKKFRKDNETKTGQQVRDDAGVETKVFPDDSKYNIFMPIINNAIINGQIDATAYNRYVGTKGKHLTQKALEAIVTKLMSPEVNAFTTVELVKTGKGISVMLDGAVIGFINDPVRSQRTLDFAKEMDAITDPNMIHLDQYHGGNWKIAKWKKDELTLKDKSTHKPFITYIERREKSLAQELHIVEKVNEAKDNKAFTHITRKTSGNFIQDPDNLQDVSDFNIVDLFHNPHDVKGTTLESVDGNTNFERNPLAGEYYNHDMEYSQGFTYGMFMGANSFDDQTQTQIPIPLIAQKANRALAGKAYSLISDIVKITQEEGARLPGPLKGKVNPDDKFTTLIKELSNIFTVVDYSYVKDNPDAPNYIRFSERGIEISTEMDGKAAYIFIAYEGKFGSPYMYVKSKSMVSQNLATNKSLTGNFTFGQKVFEQTLKNLLENKVVNVNHAKLRDKTPYLDGKTYKEYWIANNMVKTDVQPMRNGDGKAIKNEKGNAIPAIREKGSTEGKNSNFIISISPNVSVNLKEKPAPKVAKGKETRTAIPVPVAPTPIPSEKVGGVASIVKELMDGGVVTITDPALLGEVNNALPDNRVLELKEVEGGWEAKAMHTGRMKRFEPGEVVPEGKINKVRADKAKAWWATAFPNVPFDPNVIGLIERNGTYAWGIFEDAAVTMSTEAPAGTEYHEGFHAAFWLYNTPEQQAELLAETKSLYGEATNETLEEILADKFQDYMLAKGEFKLSSNKIMAFFQKLWNAIKGMVRRRNKADVLFDNIREGEFNYEPTERAKKFAKSVKRFKAIEGFNTSTEIEAVNALTYSIISVLDNDERVSSTAVSKLYAVKDQVKAEFMGLTKGADPSHFGTILSVVSTKNYDQFFAKALLNVKRQFGIAVKDEIDLADTQQLEKDWDDTAFFARSTKDSVGNLVKKVVMTTQSKERGHNLGLPQFLDFNAVYPYLLRNMQGATNVEEMIARLAALGQFDSSMFDIATQIMNDVTLQNAWVSNFRNQKINRVITLITPDGTKNELENKRSSHYVLSDGWINKFNTKLFGDYFTPAKVKELKAAKNAISYEVNTTGKINTKAVADLFNEIGIDVTEAGLRNILNMSNLRSKYGSSKNIYDNVIVKALAIFNDIDKYAKDKDSYKKFDNFKNFNTLAAAEIMFRYDLVENTTTNINGDLVNNYTIPTFMSGFFDMFNALASDNLRTVNVKEAKEALLTKLKDYAKDPTMSQSNWLWSGKNVQGMLFLVKDKNNPKDKGKKDIEALTVDHINIDFIDKFNYFLSGGIKNTSSKDTNQFNNMPDKDWAFVELSTYLGTSSAVMTTVHVPTMIAADSGNVMFIESPRFGGVLDSGNLDKKGAIYAALNRIVGQEINRMIQARDLMFDVADDFSLTVKSDLRLDKLQRNYHYKNVDKNGKPILIANGKPTGNVFQFHNLTNMNSGVLLTSNGVYMADKYGTNFKAKGRAEIQAKIDEYVKTQVASAKVTFGEFESAIKRNPAFAKNFSSYAQFLTEFVLNHKISNIEQASFLGGLTAEYKQDKQGSLTVLDPNKRFKQIMSPKINLSGLGKKHFKAATIKDIELPTRIFETIANSIADGIRKDDPRVAKDNFNIKNVKKGKPETAIEILVYDIVKGYLDTNIGDGQGYVSLARYEEIHRQAGRWTPELGELIRRAKRGDKLSSRDTQTLFKPLKGFHYGREFDPYLGKMVSHQIKYSSIPLIPSLVAGTDAAVLADWMDTNSLDEVFFESAEKVGITDVIEVTDGNGNIVAETLDNYSDSNGYEFNYYRNEDWGIQLDVPDHLTDTSNKLGTQIAKIIIANLNPRATYEYNGKKVKASELLKDYMDTMSANIQEDADNLLTRLGVTFDGDRYVISDITELGKILKEEVESRNISENYALAIEVITNANGEKEFNMPLFVTTMANKWESITTSLFTNNVVNQKQPGGSVVMVSSAFLTNKSTFKKELTEEEAFIQEIGGTGGIEWNAEKTASGDFTLKPPTIRVSGGRKTILAEALIPRTSKLFTRMDENGEITDMSIDEIAEQAPELLEQIYYRIPYEKKSSTLVVKIVGFLPSEMSNIMVLPQEAITMSGEDFDVDKRFGMYKTFYKDKKGNLTPYRFYNTKNDAAFEQWKRSENVKQLLADIRSNPDEAIKKATTQVNRFQTLQDKAYAGQIEGIKRVAILLEMDVKDLESEGNFKKIKELKGEVYQILQDLAKEYDDLTSIRTDFTETTDVTDRMIESIKDGQRFYADIMYQLHDIDSSRTIDWKADDVRLETIIKDYEYLRTDLVNDSLRATFDAIDSPYQWNPKQARQNRIMDITKELLTNNVHFRENYIGSGFESAKQLIKEIEGITDTKAGYDSFTDLSTQLWLRKRNLDGRILKGMAADMNSFISVMQVAKMYLRKDLGINMSYDLNEYDLKTLQKQYGKENVVVVNPKKTPSGQVTSSSITDTQIEEVTSPVEMYLYDYFKTGKVDSVSYARYADKGDIREGTKLAFVKKGETTIDQLAEIISEDTGMQVTENDIVDFISENKSPKAFRSKQAATYEATIGQGREVVESIDKPKGVAKVRHMRFGWNQDNTYTNANGKFTTENTSQLLALIVDIVKEGNIPNVNSYNFNIFGTILMTGVPLNEAGMFIRQPILNTLSEIFFDKQSIVTDTEGNEISETKQVYQAALLAITSKRTGKKINENYSKKMHGEGRVLIGKDKLVSVLGINPEINHESNADMIAFTKSEMKAMIEFSNDVDMDKLSHNNLNYLNGKDDAWLAKTEKYLRNQLMLAEKFLKYKEAGEAYQDMLNALSADRKAVGPALSKVIGVHNAIHKAAYYPTFNSTDKKLGNKLVTTNLPYTDQGTYIDSFVRRSGEGSKVNLNRGLYEEAYEGARIFSNVNGQKMPAVMAVLPYKFGMTHDSAYAVIESYQKLGGDAAFGVLSTQFLKYSPAFVNFSNQVHNATHSSFSADLYDEATKFATIAVTGNLPFLQTSNRNEVVGIGKEDVVFDTEMPIEDYGALSAANKLAFLKEKNKDKYQYDVNIINHLEPRLGKLDIEFNGYQKIDFLNTFGNDITDDHLINSFEDLYFSDDVYEVALAKDLVRYNFFTTGFTTTRNSFAKLLPISVQKDIGLDTYLAEVMNASQDVDYLLKGQSADLIEKFIKNNSGNAKVVPYVDITRKIKGGNWAKKRNTGLITVSLERLKNEGVRVAESEYVTIPTLIQKRELDGTYTTLIVGSKLYKVLDTNGKLITYYPVSKLGGKGVIELSDESFIKGNNERLSREDYVDVANGSYTKLNMYGKALGGKDRLLAENMLWAKATKGINVLFDGETGDKEFGTGDLVVVPAARREKSLTEKENFAYYGKKAASGLFTFTEKFSKITDAIESGATVGIPTNLDNNDNKLRDINLDYYFGYKSLAGILNTYVSAGFYTSIVENGISYYAKKGETMNLATGQRKGC